MLSKRKMFPRGSGNKPKTAGKKGLQGEDALQKLFCEILDLFQLPYYSIPNGTYKASKFVKWLFEVTGLKAGVPDLHIPMPILCAQSVAMEFLCTRNTSVSVMSKTKAPVTASSIDLGVNVSVVKHHSLYIEVKIPGNYPSTIQKKWHEKLRGLGHRVEVVRTTDELEQLVLDCYPNNAIRFNHLLKQYKLKNNHGKVN